MSKQRIPKTRRPVKPDKIRRAREELQKETRHSTIDHDRFPTAKAGSEAKRPWSKIHRDAFNPGRPPNGIAFTNNAHLAYLQLLSLLHGHRTWIPRTRDIQKHLGLTARQTRERLALLVDLKLIAIVPIQEVDAEFYACKQAIVILNLPGWYFDHGPCEQQREDDEHFEEVAKRRASKTSHPGLRLVKSNTERNENHG
jgi:hypothetical protein